LDEDLKVLNGRIDERNKAGAQYEKMNGKADKLETKGDPKASSARDESDRAYDNYKSVHDSTLQDLENWKRDAASKFQPIHAEVVDLMQAGFGGAFD
jgi:hypothetical protein